MPNGLPSVVLDSSALERGFLALFAGVCSACFKMRKTILN